jgi:hypothetical protein
MQMKRGWFCVCHWPTSFFIFGIQNLQLINGITFMNKLLVVGILHVLLACNSPKTYYIDSENGNDNNSGIALGQSWQSLNKVNAMELQPGDEILLAQGQTFFGSLDLRNTHGTDDNPIKISSYSPNDEGQDGKASINAKGYLNGILLENCSHIEVSNLLITANGGGVGDDKIEKVGMRCGVLIKATTSGSYNHISLKNLTIKDIFYEEEGFKRPKGEVKTANGTQSYGWGIRVINNAKGAFLKDLIIQSCVVENVSHTGIKLTSRYKGQNFNISNLNAANERIYGVQNFKIENNKVLKTGGPGIQMSGVKDGHIHDNYVDHSGSNDDSRKWGRGSGLWTWGSSDILIEKNHFLNANGPGDSAGAHIDFNCTNVVLQYNFSANNAGGFCEILGSNYNCAYRYNISVNDGYRLKGVDGAFQEGKTFWLSGFSGKQKKRQGPFNSYFYNNTIYVSEDIISKIAVDKATSGALLANNIFYIKGDAKVVLGDQYNPEKAGISKIRDVVFENNLYLKNTNWPEDVLIQDRKPIIGNPGFAKDGGLSISDYIPANIQLTKDQGIEISMIPNDSIGLTVGLKVKEDILGNPIKGKPDFGAIELN